MLSSPPDLKLQGPVVSSHLVTHPLGNLGFVWGLGALICQL